MSKLLSFGRMAGNVGMTFGVAAAGAAIGFAAERYAVGRSLRGEDPYAEEPLGTLRGAPYTIETDDGVHLHVEVDEPDGRPDLTVVFTHGYALNLDAWHFQRRDLRGQARLVFWDQRSHGRSSRAPGETVSFDRLAADLSQVIDETVPKRAPVVLVGHSMGGMTVMALAEARPELFADRVAGVGLVATSHQNISATLGMPGPAGRLAHRIAPGLVAALARQPDLIEHGRRAGSDLGYVLTRRYSFVGRASPSLVAFTAQMNAATPIDVVAEFLPLFAANDQRAAVAALPSLPVLIVGAEEDRLTPVEHSRELADLLPEAEYVEVPEAGHMVLLERHEIVTDYLEKLLQRARTARVRWWRRRKAR
ncbi:MAG TPA: alpha/beta hydrolase [Jiangellaceae bacterium]|nr:alpha/beta hydrolase [Jiangellaceae bacterium]